MHSELLAAAADGAHIITANARLARAVRGAFAAQQTSAAWLDPDILPWSAWIEREWREHLYAGNALPLLAPRQELALWQSIVTRYPGADGLIDPIAAAQLAREAWRLANEWRLPWNSSEWQAQEDSAVFWDWAEVYRKQVDALGRLDPARLDDFVAERLDVSTPRNYWMAGFEEITPRQREIIARLESAGGTVTLALPPHDPPGNAIRVELPAMEAEVEAAAHWAQRRLKAHPTAAIGVIFTRLDRVRSTVDRLFRSAIPGNFHISLGPRLRERPLVSAALNLLELLGSRVPFASLSSALLSPYVGGYAGEFSQRSLWEAELRRRGITSFTLTSLLRDEQGPALFRQRLRAVLPLGAKGGERLKASLWAARFREVLRAMRWPGEASLASDEYQTLRRWNLLLNEFASLDLVWPELSASAALRALREMAASVEFETENRGEPVQVMGVLEAAGSHFDHLWIGGIDEPSWPPSGTVNPFIPLSLARERKMPYAANTRTLDYARQVTRRLLASSAEVVLSHTARDGDRDIAVSPLVAHVPLRAEPLRYAPWQRQQAALDEFEDVMAPALIPGASTPGGVNAIRLQAQCPFRAFAEVRLAARPLERPDMGLDPRARGNLIHQVLEASWRELKTSERLKQIGGWELTDVIARAVEQAVKALPVEERLQSLERERLEKLTRSWLEFERGREAPFTVEHAEQRRQVELSGLRLDTRVDRVDRLADGPLVLIDYKTSAPAPERWKGDRPDDPQLPVYAVGTEQPLAGVMFGQVRAGNVKFAGWTSRKDVAPGTKTLGNFAETVAAWRPVLENLARDFMHGESKVDPKDKGKTCQWCHLETLCRLNEKAMREEE
ncbi:MAG: PD-(D/E)XK nuclease family protein [Bryobacterales bacterium]|nr:PD-(D/E)XK nuclease family protein [Bryobacterales bacterium]